MKMREMRMEKISWVKREMNRTRKLPSNATITTTMTTSHAPTHTRPTMYSMPWDLQNYSQEGKHDERISVTQDQCCISNKPCKETQILTLKKASSNTSSGPEKPITSIGWAATRQKIMPNTEVEIISSDTPIMLSTLSAVERSSAKQKCIQKSWFVSFTLFKLCLERQKESDWLWVISWKTWRPMELKKWHFFLCVCHILHLWTYSLKFLDI